MNEISGSKKKRTSWKSDCPICGRVANTSKWWTGSTKGKKYHYLRFYHSAKNIHFLPSDQIYSNFSRVKKKREDVYSVLLSLAQRKMGSRKYSFTSLKAELQDFKGDVMYNETVVRALKRAILMGVIEKTREGKKFIYSKVVDSGLKKELEIQTVSIQYDFTAITTKVSAFINIHNVGNILVGYLPFYIPCGKVETIADLSLHVHSENGEIPLENLQLIYSDSVETSVSISLNKNLKKGERESLFLRFELPRDNKSIKFITPFRIGLLRVTLIRDLNPDASIARTLVDGAIEYTGHFQSGSRCFDSHVCERSEFENVLRGEAITVTVS